MLRRACRARAARTGPTDRDEDDAFNPRDSEGDDDGGDVEAAVLDTWGARGGVPEVPRGCSAEARHQCWARRATQRRGTGATAAVEGDDPRSRGGRGGHRVAVV